MYESANAQATWQTCVVAKDQVKVLVLNYRDIKELTAKRPEVESDFRAGMVSESEPSYRLCLHLSTTLPTFTSRHPL